MVLSFGGHSPAHTILPSFPCTLNPCSPERNAVLDFWSDEKRLFWGPCPEEVSKLDVSIIAVGMFIRHNVHAILLALYWGHRDAVHYTYIYIYIFTIISWMSCPTIRKNHVHQSPGRRPENVAVSRVLYVYCNFINTHTGTRGIRGYNPNTGRIKRYNNCRSPYYIIYTVTIVSFDEFFCLFVVVRV